MFCNEVCIIFTVTEISRRLNSNGNSVFSLQLEFISPGIFPCFATLGMIMLLCGKKKKRSAIKDYAKGGQCVVSMIREGNYEFPD